MATRPPPPRCGPRWSAPLIDDLVREIFLRLPPHEPRGLVRAAAACRSWRGILSDAAFAREYRALHGAPPMLGFLYDELYYTDDGPFEEMYQVSHFVSTATFRSTACQDRQHWRVLDSRHGLVLFYTPTLGAEFVVCDLVTGDQWEIHADSDCKDIMWWDEDDDEYKYESIRCNAAVLCSSDRCDHLNCHGGPFRVALVGSGNSEEGALEAVATVYSSETGEWSEMISVGSESYIDGIKHNAVVGNKVYVPCVESDSLVEYNIGEEEISVIDTPLVNEDDSCIELIGVEDGMLLFASVVNPGLYLWSMEAGPSGAAGWARHRVIDLKPSLPPDVLSEMSDVWAVGFAEGVSVIFLMTEDGLYTIDLNSGKGEKVARESNGKGHALHELLHWSMGAVADLGVSFIRSCWC